MESPCDGLGIVPLLDGETTPKEVLGAVKAAHDATHNETQTDEITFIFLLLDSV